MDNCQPYQGDVDLVVCQINHYRPVPPFLNISACYYPLISADQVMVNSLPQGGLHILADDRQFFPEEVNNLNLISFSENQT